MRAYGIPLTSEQSTTTEQETTTARASVAANMQQLGGKGEHLLAMVQLALAVSILIILTAFPFKDRN